MATLSRGPPGPVDSGRGYPEPEDPAGLGAGSQYAPKQRPRDAPKQQVKDLFKFDGDRKEFKDWCYKMADKLSRDSAYFDFIGEEKTIFYIVSRLKGALFKDVEHRLDLFGKSKDPFKDIADVFSIIFTTSTLSTTSMPPTFVNTEICVKATVSPSKSSIATLSASLGS